MHTLVEAESRLPTRPLDEFFVYRDAEAAEDWENEGATSANVNTMLHFLINKLDKSAALREVTLVCDQLDEPMQHLLADLSAQLQAPPEDTTR
jgi:hypothetical protein